jgi:hypothetical protein
MGRRKAKKNRRLLPGVSERKSVPRPVSAYLFYRVLRAREASVRGLAFRFGASDA